MENMKEIFKEDIRYDMIWECDDMSHKIEILIVLEYSQCDVYYYMGWDRNFV
jgi:hypothetical protein